MKKLHYFLPFFLLISCNSNTESTSENSSSNSDEKEEVKTKTDDTPSEEWLIAKFTDGDLGYMTKDNATKVKGAYSFLRPYKNHYASVKSSGQEKMGIIDEFGNVIIPLEYEYTSDYASGLIAVQKEKLDKIGYIDIQGKEIVPPKYAMGFSFKNGLARVANGNYINALSSKYYEKANYGFINNRGEEIIPLEYDWASDFVDGLAAVAKGGKYYFIDTTGARIDAIDYKLLSGFKGDYCAAAKGSKLGFINKKMEFVIPELYNNYMYFFDVNKQFNFVSTNESEMGETSFLSGDGFLFLQKGKKWGILDIANNVKTNFIYDNLEVPTGFGFIKFKKGDKYGYGSYENGIVTEILPAEFDYIYHYKDNLLIIAAKGDYKTRKFGAYNHKGEQIVPIEFDGVDDIGFGFSSVEKDKKFGIYNDQGKPISDIIYDYVGTMDEDGNIYVNTGDDYVYLDKTGKQIKK